MTDVAGESLIELTAMMDRLRRECAWKAGQTHRSLERFLLEEAHEVLEAIDDGDLTGDWSHLREELGDLMLQVWFHAAIAAEAGEFTIDDVTGDLMAKLVRRNPHVFASADPSDEQGPQLDAEAVNALWERMKATEKQRTSVLHGLPPTLPALLLADKIIERSEREGSRLVPVEQPTPTAANQIGVRLLALVAEAREVGVDPEQALRDVVRHAAGDPTPD